MLDHIWLDKYLLLNIYNNLLYLYLFKFFIYNILIFLFYLLPKSGFILELVNEMILSIPDIGVNKFVQRLKEYHMDWYLIL